MHSSEYIRDCSYVDYGPAYQYGVASYAKYPGRRFNDVEANLASDWERAKKSDFADDVAASAKCVKGGVASR